MVMNLSLDKERRPFSVDRKTFNRLALGAVYYACGRATYMPGFVSRFIQRHISDIDPTTADTIIGHIERRGRHDKLGWVIDSEVWDELRGFLLEHDFDDFEDHGVISDGQSDFWLFFGASYRHDKGSDLPFLEASDYLRVLRDNAGEFNPKWSHNILRDTVEAFGKDWYLEAGPVRDPEGFRAIYDYLLPIYEGFCREEPGMFHPDLTLDDMED